MSYWTGKGKRLLAAARFKPPKLAENRYSLALRRLIDAVGEHYLRSLDLREDAYHPRAGRLDVLHAQVQIAVRKPVEQAFDEMSHSVQRANKLALTSVKPSDMRMQSDIARFRDQNVQLITNAVGDFGKQVRSIFEDPENIGLSERDLKKKLLERTDVSKSRAELIARDQTLKLNGQINMTRQTNAGITQYTWSTSHDDRVRESHKELDGQVFSWTSPPEPGHPGEDFQCRCVAIPVLSIDLDG